MRTKHPKTPGNFPGRSTLTGLALALAAFVLPQPAARAANGTAYFFDVDGATPGFGSPSGSYNLSSTNWTTDSTGSSASVVMPQNTQWTFGNVGSDLAGCTFTITGDGFSPGPSNGQMAGIAINSTSANITYNSVGGRYVYCRGGAQSWTVAAGSTLTLQGSPGGAGCGFYFAGAAVTLAGGGTFTFANAIGWASGGTITENGAGLVVNLQSGRPPHDFYTGGFTLTSGTLNFATAASVTAFQDFPTGKPFAINGGTVDNTSGSAMTLTVGSAGGYSFGGDFTFAGSSSLNFGTAPVVLTGTRQITVGANKLTIGGAISGSGYGLTKAGAGTLLLNGTNTYDGLTTVSTGTFGGSGTLAGAATFDAGSKAVFTVTPGGTVGNNSTVMKITGVMTYNANEVHLNLPANLPGGDYVLAYSDATPVANGTFPTPVVDSGSFAGDVSGATITLDPVTKHLILSAATAFTGPVQLAITQVNGGVNPAAGVSFDVVVQAHNGSGVATNVLSSTDVTLSVNTGTSGSLGGTFVGTIPTGQNQITINGVTLSKAEAGVILQATRTSGDTLTPGVSSSFTVTPGAASASASSVISSPNGTVADGVSPITVTVTVIDAFTNLIPGVSVQLVSSRGATDTILPASGVTGSNGVATFTVTSSTVGSATLSATVGSTTQITQTAPVVFVAANPHLIIGAKQFTASSIAPDPGPPAPINVVSNDLFETSVVAVTGGDGFSQPEAWMRNGLFTDGNQLYQKNSNNPLAVTYSMNLTTNPLGYDIKEIRMFSNPYLQRSGQSYDILYSLVGAPDTFIYLGSVNTPEGEYGVLMTRTYDGRAASPDTGAAILSGVAKIRFNFRIVGPYGTIWREFDVTGTGLGGGPTHNISGTVTLSGSGLSGVTVSDGTRTATTAADGTYTITSVPDGSYTVTPTLNGYTFTPASSPATVSGADVTTGMDFTATSASPYDAWKNGTFAHPFTDTDPTHDPDGDGLTNQQEFAFGLDPTTGTSCTPISQQLDKATGTFKYTRTKDSGLTYIYQSSTTLSDPWDDFTPDSAVSNNATPVEEITVTVPSSLRANSKLFLRVKAQ